VHSLVSVFGAEYEAGNNAPHIQQTQTLPILMYHSSRSQLLWYLQDGW